MSRVNLDYGPHFLTLQSLDIVIFRLFVNLYSVNCKYKSIIYLNIVENRKTQILALIKSIWPGKRTFATKRQALLK